MKHTKIVIAIILVAVLLFLGANWLFFPFNAESLVTDAEAVGAIVDQVDTEYSVLTLVEESNTGKLKLIHFRANPIFQSRYQAAEVIAVDAGEKQNFGFADFFQKFVVTVEDRTMTVSGTQSRF